MLMGLNNSLNYSLPEGSRDSRVARAAALLASWGGIFPVLVLVAVWSAMLFEFSAMLFLFALAVLS